MLIVSHTRSEPGLRADCGSGVLRSKVRLSFSSILRRQLALALVVALVWPATAAEIQALPVTEIALGAFVHNGVHEEASTANEDGIANIGFILGDQAVAVVDPGGSYAEGEGLRAAIQVRTEKPIRYVILTHVHPDHI